MVQSRTKKRDLVSVWFVPLAIRRARLRSSRSPYGEPDLDLPARHIASRTGSSRSPYGKLDFDNSIYYIYKIRNDLEISDDFGAFWRYLEQAPEMTIRLDHRSTAKSAESPFGHSQLEAQVFTNLQDYP
ncbi:hypothetical protein F2Q69_00008800 [Brassica cretica]|uniref:Uncharacterized protein n=1 Tax=Brassica cretica TaxID=69181 RepID=A0A8S9P8H3_BRACR|nr:hypothetical protein F2Q69_00008800 [Brassica cretica]